MNQPILGDTVSAPNSDAWFTGTPLGGLNIISVGENPGETAFAEGVGEG
jgi:hypothetical protein